MNEELKTGDFAKIVRASNGQQVLFFLEDSNENPGTLHCMTYWDGAAADIKFGGIATESLPAALAMANQAMADKIINQVAEFYLFSEEE